MENNLSVCIVAYDNYEDIESAIKTIEDFTSRKLNKKIYIVDNGVQVSDENKIEKFKNFIKNYNDVEYINLGDNLGFGKANNSVLGLINSKYHAIVNPDILLCEDSFSKILKWMDQNSDIGMAIPKLIDEDGKRQNVYRRELTVFDMFNRMILKEFFRNRAKKHVMSDMDYSIPFKVPFGQGSFLVIRTQLFKQLNGFDDRFFMYCEDADLCKRVNDVSKLMYYPGTKVVHKWEKGSHKDMTLFKYHLKSMIYYFEKWGVKFF